MTIKATLTEDEIKKVVLDRLKQDQPDAKHCDVQLYIGLNDQVRAEVYYQVEVNL